MKATIHFQLCYLNDEFADGVEARVEQGRRLLWSGAATRLGIVETDAGTAAALSDGIVAELRRIALEEDDDGTVHVDTDLGTRDRER